MVSADEVFWLGMSGRLGDVLPMLSGVPISLKIAKYTFAEDSHLLRAIHMYLVSKLDTTVAANLNSNGMME